MTSTDHSPDATREEQPRSGQYAALDIDDGSVVIYDLEDPNRWIQSTGALPVVEAR